MSLLLFAQQQKQQQQQQQQQHFTSLVSGSLDELLDLSSSHTTTGIMGGIDVSELGKGIQNFAHVLVAQLHVVRGQRHGSSDRRTYTAAPRLDLAQDATFEDHPQIPSDYNLRFRVIEKNVSSRVPGTTNTFDCMRSPDARILIFHLQINFQRNVYMIVLQDVPSDTTPQRWNASVRHFSKSGQIIERLTIVHQRKVVSMNTYLEIPKSCPIRVDNVLKISHVIFMCVGDQNSVDAMGLSAGVLRFFIKEFGDGTIKNLGVFLQSLHYGM